MGSSVFAVICSKCQVPHDVGFQGTAKGSCVAILETIN